MTPPLSFQVLVHVFIHQGAVLDHQIGLLSALRLIGLQWKAYTARLIGLQWKKIKVVKKISRDLKDSSESETNPGWEIESDQGQARNISFHR